MSSLLQRVALLPVVILTLMGGVGAAPAADPIPAAPVIAVNDRGINPYHDEFRAEAYADEDILALTENFTRHPSEYLPGYPADAEALQISFDQGWLPPADVDIFSDVNIVPGRLYWIPGTKIIGAIAGTPEQRANPDNSLPILDGYPGDFGHGHGTGSASAAVGNTTGSCPACLLFVVQKHDPGPAAEAPFVDISNNSYLTSNGGDEHVPTRTAARKGQVVLFGAGNGQVGPWIAPWVDTIFTPGQGPSWNLRVGGTEPESGRPIFGDAINAEVSSYMAQIRAATSSGTDDYREFGGTSGAGPIVAGVMGSVLYEARRALGDTSAGAEGEGGIASGTPVPSSPFLADGRLGRDELMAIVIRSAEHRVTDNGTYEPGYPTTVPYVEPAAPIFDGYGTVDVQTVPAAVDVLLGAAPLPARGDIDAYFRRDHDARDAYWGECGCSTWLDVTG